MNRFHPSPDGYIHLAPIGNYAHPKTGLMQQIDNHACDCMVEDFRGKLNDPHFPGILIDHDHFSMDPDKPSTAAGWIVDLEHRPETGLWGKVRWSDTGEKAVAGGDYRFVSPVWMKHECEECGENMIRPMKLHSVALTNAPNIPGMIPISNRSDASTPAPKRDQIKGSKTNKPQSAKDTKGSITLDAATEKSLQAKADDHNASMKKADRPAWSRTSVATLRAVYRRGAGAFSTSHRPGKTRGQWAQARVNAFLDLLRKGKPNNPKYTTDDDLLPTGHPARTAMKNRIAQAALFVRGIYVHDDGKITPLGPPLFNRARTREEEKAIFAKMGGGGGSGGYRPRQDPTKGDPAAPPTSMSEDSASASEPTGPTESTKSETSSSSPAPAPAPAPDGELPFETTLDQNSATRESIARIEALREQLTELEAKKVQIPELPSDTPVDLNQLRKELTFQRIPGTEMLQRLEEQKRINDQIKARDRARRDAARKIGGSNREKVEKAYQKILDDERKAHQSAVDKATKANQSIDKAIDRLESKITDEEIRWKEEQNKSAIRGLKEDLQNEADAKKEEERRKKAEAEAAEKAKKDAAKAAADAAKAKKEAEEQKRREATKDVTDARTQRARTSEYWLAIQRNDLVTAATLMPKADHGKNRQLLQKVLAGTQSRDSKVRSQANRDLADLRLSPP